MVVGLVLSLFVFIIVLVLSFGDWLSPNSVFKQNSYVPKVICVFVAFISFMLYTVFLLLLAAPNSSQSIVQITEISDVYKSNSISGTVSYYYVLKEGDDKYYEIKVDNVSKGDSNYIITKEYSNDTITNELVLKDVNNIPSLPNFNK